VALSWLAQVEALFSALCLGSLLAAKADIEVPRHYGKYADSAFSCFSPFSLNYSNKTLAIIPLSS